jgi:hypothetical protein
METTMAIVGIIKVLPGGGIIPVNDISGTGSIFCTAPAASTSSGDTTTTISCSAMAATIRSTAESGADFLAGGIGDRRRAIHNTPVSVHKHCPASVGRLILHARRSGTEALVSLYIYCFFNSDDECLGALQRTTIAPPLHL